MVGVVSLDTAIDRAKTVGLDLVEISPTADPPVCKILDFGRFKYDAKKKQQSAKKKQKVVEIKEIKLRPNIGDHDLEVKIRSIQKFITAGEKVKITLRFRGREMAHQDIGMNVVQKILAVTAEIAQPETQPKIEGNQILTILVAK